MVLVVRSTLKPTSFHGIGQWGRLHFMVLVVRSTSFHGIWLLHFMVWCMFGGNCTFLITNRSFCITKLHQWRHREHWSLFGTWAGHPVCELSIELCLEHEQGTLFVNWALNFVWNMSIDLWFCYCFRFRSSSSRSSSSSASFPLTMHFPNNRGGVMKKRKAAIMTQIKVWSSSQTQYSYLHCNNYITKFSSSVLDREWLAGHSSHTHYH